MSTASDPERAGARVRRIIPVGVIGPAVATMLALALSAPIEPLARGQDVTTTTPRTRPLPIEGMMPSLSGATAWLNSPPLTAESLRGRVAVVDFWTYTCINWQRSQPYVRAWAEKYKDQGLVVIGVHTPEFEKNLDNVRPALGRFRVEYPVAVDSDYAIWEAFRNRYWPAIYVVDAKGDIRHHQFGEGEYERTEAVIQQLLREAGYSGMGNEAVKVDARGSEEAADWKNLGSTENYLGRNRAQGFVSEGAAVPGKGHSYVVPRSLTVNQWALGGAWTVNAGAITLDKPGGRLVYRFHARDLHLIMGPSSRGSSVRFRVLLDGRPPGKAHGADIDEQGRGTVTEPRLYQLIRQPPPIVDGTFEVEFLDPGLEAYVFTFG